MNVLVVYDTTYGNTEIIAKAIAQKAGAIIRRALEVNPACLNAMELLIIGSPTHGGFPTPAIDAFLKEMATLQGKRTAVFDTRTRTTIFGYAAPKIMKKLEKAGALVVVPPEGFYVRGTRGPLVDGEKERSGEWTKRIFSSAIMDSTSDPEKAD
jgi:flavodoxin